MAPKEGDLYRGVNVAGLQSHGHLLDMINIMAYDGGKQLDVITSYLSFHQYKAKKLVGFQVGKQGWGDALLTLDDVVQVCSMIEDGDGCFVWAYFKQGTPSVEQVVETAAAFLDNHEEEPVGVPCPHCGKGLFITK